MNESIYSPEALLFVDEADDAPIDLAAAAPNPWNVLIVDDEDDVHAVTRLVLDGFLYGDRGVRLHHAYSAAQARSMLDEIGEIALIFLDVVMESDNAGLELVEHIRAVRGDRLVRIVLRTGQPGQAPERSVIRDYDINDYKSKTEFTADKLYTTTLTALRSYEDLLAIDASRRGLEKIIASSASLFQARSIELFASGVLSQMSALLGIGREGILCVYQGGMGVRKLDDIFILASAGRFEHVHGALLDNTLDPEVSGTIVASMRARENVFRDDATTLYFETPHHRRVVVYLQARRSLTGMQRQLLEVFCKQVSIGIDNLHLFHDLREAHEELRLAHVATVVTLADLAELRDSDTGAHVLRVAKLSVAIARELRDAGPIGSPIDDDFIEALSLASIMHDIGKVTTPDRILLKPGSLDEGELTIMRSHAESGETLLAKARDLAPKSRYLELGVEISGGHHEWWDGGGYPRGVAGNDIPLSARIVAIADVFDALTHDRVYKGAWPKEKAIAYIRARRGTQFDPDVVDAFLGCIDAVELASEEA